LIDFNQLPVSRETKIIFMYSYVRMWPLEMEKSEPLRRASF
jgi:hypothetical protein